MERQAKVNDAILRGEGYAFFAMLRRTSFVRDSSVEALKSREQG